MQRLHELIEKAQVCSSQALFLGSHLVYYRLFMRPTLKAIEFPFFSFLKTFENPNDLAVFDPGTCYSSWKYVLYPFVFTI